MMAITTSNSIRVKPRGELLRTGIILELLKKWERPDERATLSPGARRLCRARRRWDHSKRANHTSAPVLIGPAGWDARVENQPSSAITPDVIKPSPSYCSVRQIERCVS